MEILHPVCCGLDVHAKTAVACLIVKGKRTVRTFGTMTQDLLELGDWLLEAGCPVVVMESTGVYWKPIYNVLEGVCEVVLVNAYHVKQVPGRKTDVRDCEWLADLLRHGLLRASFIPPAPIRDLRELTRYRASLVRDRTRFANRVQKVAESGNVKLGQVVSDALGVSGRRILRAMADGETQMDRLLNLADRQLQPKHEQLRKALDGRLTDAQRYVLGELLDRYDETMTAIARVSEQIRKEVESEQQEPFLGEAIRSLDEITGVGREIAQVIVSEIGIDLSRFPSAKHLASWAGVCPGNNESAGKRRSGKTTKGNLALKTALTQAAWAAARKKGTYLAVRFERYKARSGQKRAIVATAHKIVVIIYEMLSKREAYREMDIKHLSRRTIEQERARLLKKLQDLEASFSTEDTSESTEAA
jgi:transposase